MKWIWQEKDWFDFKYDAEALRQFEDQFLRQAGTLEGAAKHINKEDELLLLIDLACDEALFSSKIEGEQLNRDSLRSSLQKHLGLRGEQKKALPAEEGMSKLMATLYRSYDKPLTDEMLGDWHAMVMSGRWDVSQIGFYRKNNDSMQIVSGYVGRAKVHYEAPPSAKVVQEMKHYINWFNKTAPSGSKPLSVLIRAGIAHLYFECIHPFEDGNGRIGRVIALKAIFQGLKQPLLIALSDVLNSDKKNYYRALAKNNHSNEITEWLIYFSKTILKAQQHTQRITDFVIAKKKFYVRFQNKLNQRQQKVITRLFKAGIDGFEGGLSASNYIKIANTSASTATRDLQQLVEMGAVSAQGELKYRRYYLKLD